MSLSGKSLLALVAAAMVSVAAAPARALNVVWDSRTPPQSIKWGEQACVREQMEILAMRICRALYGDNPRSHLHENFTITLYLAPVRGGNPAFASGRRITWKVGEHPGGDASGGMGLLCHEMTHVLDMGSNRVFTEGMADWTRNYKVWYNRCTTPAAVLDKRYKALRGSRNYGKYMSGANFIDYMTQTYGEGTIYKILMGFKEHGQEHWKTTFGKTFDELMAQWKTMQTIWDPVFMWTYTSTADGKVRYDRNWCRLRQISTVDTADRSGAWLDGASSARIDKIKDGNISIAMHGWFGGDGRKSYAIASLGAAKAGNGKALLLATSPKGGEILAHVIASVPGAAYGIVSTTPIQVPGLANKPHSVVVAVRGGNAAAVVVDGVPAAKIDMASKCSKCTFAAAFSVGGMEGGLGVHGVEEPRGEGGVRLDDVRVFSRAFRGPETKTYAETFGTGYRPAVPVRAEWVGGMAGNDISEPFNWFCVNSVGERVTVLPSQETDVVVYGRNLPSIPPNAKFACKSFTIDGWASVEDKSVDLRGVRIVDIADYSRIKTKKDRALVVNALRGKRIRLDGTLAVARGMNVTESLDMKGGSVLRLPADVERSYVNSIVLSGEGEVTLWPGAMPEPGASCDLMRMGQVPEDLSRFRLHGAKEADFRVTSGGKRLGVRRR